jgi:muramoyltetrapeptide carboxypeptidase
LLEKKIAWQPGWLLGFSDVTALLLARLAAGFAGGVHGPLLTTLAAEPSGVKNAYGDFYSGKRSLIFTDGAQGAHKPLGP